MKRYAWLISCEEYTDFDDISFCHSDAFLMKETLESFCDYEKKDVESNNS